MKCEVCGRNGFDRNEMTIDQLRKIFVGPCCLGNPAEPAKEFKPEEVDWGVSVTKKDGVQAYAEYSGLRLEFRKSPDQIKHLLSGKKQTFSDGGITLEMTREEAK